MPEYVFIVISNYTAPINKILYSLEKKVCGTLQMSNFIGFNGAEQNMKNAVR